MRHCTRLPVPVGTPRHTTPTVDGERRVPRPSPRTPRGTERPEARHPHAQALHGPSRGRTVRLRVRATDRYPAMRVDGHRPRGDALACRPCPPRTALVPRVGDRCEKLFMFEIWRDFRRFLVMKVMLFPRSGSCSSRILPGVGHLQLHDQTIIRDNHYCTPRKSAPNTRRSRRPGSHPRTRQLVARPSETRAGCGGLERGRVGDAGARMDGFFARASAGAR